MGKKKDPEKEAAKRARKAAKASKAAAKRERKEKRDEGSDEESDEEQVEEDIDVLLLREASELEVKELRLIGVENEREVTSRSNCSLALVGKELWVFGGERCLTALENKCRVTGDLYRRRKEEWVEVQVPGEVPCPRCSHQAVEVSNKMYVFGGEFATLTQFRHFNDLWALDPKSLTWEKRCASSGRKKPSPRSGHRARQWRGQLVIFGGFFKATSKTEWFNDVWIYAPSRDEWTEFETSSVPGAVKPPPRSACVLAVSSHDNTLLVWGGYSEVKCDNLVKAVGKEHVDSWAIDLSAPASKWDRVSIKGRSPSQRAGANAAQRGELCYVFGGVHDEDDHSVFYNQVYLLDLAHRRWHHLEQQQQQDESVLPQSRIGAAVVCKDAKNLLIVGGLLQVKGDRERTFDDVWQFDLEKKIWTCLLEPSPALLSKNNGGPAAVEEEEEEDEEKDDESATLSETSSESDEDEVKQAKP